MDVSTPESSRDSRRLVARPRLARLDLDAREFSRVESPLAPPRARSRSPATAASSSPDAARRARRARAAVLSRASIARARALARRRSSLDRDRRVVDRRASARSSVCAIEKIFRDRRREIRAPFYRFALSSRASRIAREKTPCVSQRASRSRRRARPIARVRSRRAVGRDRASATPGCRARAISDGFS